MIATFSFLPVSTEYDWQRASAESTKFENVHDIPIRMEASLSADRLRSFPVKFCIWVSWSRRTSTRDPSFSQDAWNSFPLSLIKGERKNKKIIAQGKNNILDVMEQPVIIVNFWNSLVTFWTEYFELVERHLCTLHSISEWSCRKRPQCRSVP